MKKMGSLLPSLDGKLSLVAAFGVATVFLLAAEKVSAQPVVPGTGYALPLGGDNFEDPKWSFRLTLPKSSEEQDKQQRLPGGISANGRWQESALRGEPDVIRRVPTPEGGLPGSRGAMLIRTRNSGVPNAPSGENRQDDLLFNFRSEFGGSLPVSLSPSVVVRVYMPPFDSPEWERRHGNSFGFRAGVRTTTTTTQPGKGFFRGSTTETKQEPYWPGMFICFVPKSDKTKRDSAILIIRSDQMGRDMFGPRMTETGWWTLGMSFTPDGMVHYYAHPGVEDLTPRDLIGSYYPYGFRCEYFTTFFFDLINRDDGSTWSTPWIVDDPQTYVLRH
jgi:hypothetical protein